MEGRFTGPSNVSLVLKDFRARAAAAAAAAARCRLPDGDAATLEGRVRWEAEDDGSVDVRAVNVSQERVLVGQRAVPSDSFKGRKMGAV